MHYYACDNCKKNIPNEDEAVSAGLGPVFMTKIFCQKCAKPVADFLNKHGFGKDKKQKS